MVIINFTIILLLFGILFLSSYAFAKRYEKNHPVPQSYRMNQQFHNELRGKPTIKDENGNIFVMIGTNKHYL